MVLDGNFAYLTCVGVGLVVLDISDPSIPVILSTTPTPDDAGSIRVDGDYVYVWVSDEGFFVYDASDPTALEYLHTIETPGLGYAMDIEGRYAYVADNTEGIQVVSIREFSPLIAVGASGNPGVYYHVEAQGRLAFVANEYSELLLFDLDTPWSPEVLGSYDTGAGICRAVALAGDHAFVGTRQDATFHVLDVSDPSAPALAALLDLGHDDYWGIDVVGNICYVAAGNEGLLVIDVSDPANPIWVGQYNTSHFCHSVDVQGNYAYLADWSGGLKVVDITDPTNPSFVDNLGLPGDSKSVAVDGNVAYVAVYQDGLCVVDVSNPSSLSLTDHFSPWGEDVTYVHPDGDILYVAHSPGGVSRVDISDPASPSIIDSYFTGYSSWGLSVYGDFLYLADRDGLLQTFKVHERKLVTDHREAYSVQLPDIDDNAHKFRMSAEQNVENEWYVDYHDGFEPYTLNSWLFSASIGYLRWGMSLFVDPMDLHPDPRCSGLSIEWLYEYPGISQISDIPDDQGGQLRLKWDRSAYDFADEADPVVEYSVYRRIDDERRYPPGDWDHLTTVPADAEDEYSVVVPTLADSTEEGGIVWSTFFVRARTGTPGVYYDAPPDSGYSVDNLAPNVPSGFFVRYLPYTGNELGWDVSGDEDFRYFKIYRGDSPDFPVNPENPHHSTIETAWADSGGTPDHFYKISAVDFAGNESPAVPPETVVGADDLPTPVAFTLHPNLPNPFNPSTKITFDLPERSHVRLEIFASDGRRVARLLDETRETGRHETSWRPGELSSGVYLCRMSVPGYTQTQKMLLLK